MSEAADFDKMIENALLYGVGVLAMTHRENGQIDLRVVPIEEYTELGEYLKWVDQNTRKPDA